MSVDRVVAVLGFGLDQLNGGGGITHHDPYVSDSRPDDRFQTLEQHRRVSHRRQLLRGGVRDEPQPRPGTPRQYPGLHGEQASVRGQRSA